MKTFLIKNLGCKVNQYEGQAIAEQLESRGLKKARAENTCDLVVVNTCTVTGEADRKSRYEIRRFHRLYPQAKIVVTGCYGERERKMIQAFPGVTAVVGQQEKAQFISKVEESLSALADTHPVRKVEEQAWPAISRFPGRGRAFIKVQDGCNMACRFCKVVLVRGPLRSRPAGEIMEEAGRLIRAGYRELVLAGIQLGGYGKDNACEPNLPGLMRMTLALPGLLRLRLSSINPYDVTDELITVLAEHSECCPHLHIPLQSGSNRILRAMKRGYTREMYLSLVEKLCARLNQFSLTMDCMVGFPGETEEDFEATLDVLAKTRPLKVHAFPYSVRRATQASQFPDAVPREMIRARMRVISSVAESIRRAHLASRVGRTVSFLVEETGETDTRIKGFTDDYFPVIATPQGYAAGDLALGRVTHVESDALVATCVS